MDTLDTICLVPGVTEKADRQTHGSSIAGMELYRRRLGGGGEGVPICKIITQ